MAASGSRRGDEALRTMASGDTRVTGNQLLAAITGEGKPFGPNIKDPKGLRQISVEKTKYV